MSDFSEIPTLIASQVRHKGAAHEVFLRLEHIAQSSYPDKAITILSLERFSRHGLPGPAADGRPWPSWRICWVTLALSVAIRDSARPSIYATLLDESTNSDSMLALFDCPTWELALGHAQNFWPSPYDALQAAFIEICGADIPLDFFRRADVPISGHPPCE
jgi:hypothetical protein